MRTFTFEVDDKSYTVKFDYNAISDIEEMTGKPIMTFLDEGSLNIIRILLWGGLKWKIAGITKQQAGFLVEKLTNEKKLKDVINGILKVLEYSLKKVNGEEESEEENVEGE